MEQAVQLATALQAYKQKEKYSIGNVDNLLTRTGLREGSFDTVFPTMFSLHGLDIREALEEEYRLKNITENAKKYAIDGINVSMHALATREYPVLTTDIYFEIQTILQQFIDIFYSGDPNILSNEKKMLMDKSFNKLKILFKKPYTVSYFEGGPGRVASIKILHNSFANLRSIVNRSINTNVVKLLKENGVTNSKLLDSNYLTTKVINWGHTAYGEKILTGKLIASLISLKGMGVTNQEMNLIAKDFLTETGQEKQVIKVTTGDLTRGDPEVLKLVLSSEFIQKVKVQGITKNQQELGQQEKNWSLLKFLANSRESFTNKDAIASIVLQRLLKVRASPAPIEKIELLLADALRGKRSNLPSKTTTLLNSNKAIRTKTKKVVVTKGKSNFRKDSRSPATVSSGLVNLASLLTFINSNLHEQIKKNMGTGNRRDVLNYQTGRFASSAKVERLSESRQGMLTAFYSYMKNPYSTFSQGGRQQNPRSRDPKLLISKSIRELAGAQVANRMKAVNV
jgi:hypothetical protein